MSTFKKLTLAEWERDMAGLDICCGGVHRLDDALQDDLFIERDMVRRFPDANDQHQNQCARHQTDARKTGSVDKRVSQGLAADDRVGGKSKQGECGIYRSHRP